MKKKKEPHYSKHILAVPWPLVISRFHCTREIISSSLLKKSVALRDELNTSNFIRAPGYKSITINFAHLPLALDSAHMNFDVLTGSYFTGRGQNQE